MIAPNGSPDEADVEGFPRVETCQDCCGNTRRFEVRLQTTDGGYFLRAMEVRDGPGGYEFAAHHPNSPWVALGLLRQRMAEGLSTRYLVAEGEGRRLGHGRAVGHIGYGAVVIDGEPVPFDEFMEMLQSYEGWRFDIRITDPFEPL